LSSSVSSTRAALGVVLGAATACGEGAAGVAEVTLSSLLIGHAKHKGHMRVSSWQFVPRKLQQTNRQHMVLIRPPGISDGAFQLRMDNIWFCKLLLLFKIHTKTGTGMQYHECAYVSVLEEYRGPRKPGHILHILHILHVLICLSTSAWLDQCQSAIVYERCEQAHVLYVIPVSSILGRLTLVPVGATWTKPFAMRRESAEFHGALCDKSAKVVGGGT
jgi:hypothetical protein